MYPENKAIDEILKIIEVFNSKKADEWNGDQLSRIAVRLSTLMVNLGREVAEATHEANSKYAFRKFSYAKDYKAIRQDIETKIKDAEIEATVLSIDNQREEVETQYRADLLKTLYDDCERLIMSVQSRLKYLQSERITSNLPNVE